MKGMEIAGIILIGLGVGLVVGLLGGGGGILTIPILVSVWGIAPHQASMDSIIIVFFTSLAGLVGAWRARRILWSTGLIFAGLGIPGNILGTWLSARVPGNVLMWLLAGLLVCVALWMMFAPAGSEKANGQGSASKSSRHILLAACAAVVVGLLSGFFGVGGGFAIVPALVLVMGISPRYASATSLVVLAFNMVVAGLGRLPMILNSTLGVTWHIVLFFLLGSMLGSLAGERLGRKIPAKLANVLFACLLLSVAGISVFTS